MTYNESGLEGQQSSDTTASGSASAFGAPELFPRIAAVAKPSMSFRGLWSLGYRRLIPIIPPDATISETSHLAKRKGELGKIPGIIGRDGNWHGFQWQNCEADEADLARWEAMGASIGIKTGRLGDDGDSLILIDADTLDERHAFAIREAVRNFIGPLPARVGRCPKVGYPVRVRGHFPYSKLSFGERDQRGNFKNAVEILSDGKQFVAAGTHPATRKPYEWPVALCPYEDLPSIEPAVLTAFLAHLRTVLPAASSIATEAASTAKVNQEALRGPYEIVRKAVASIRNTSEHFGSRESYRDMGYAIKAALPDNETEAFELFSEWCARWEGGENDPNIVEADWRRMKPPFRIGAGWLFQKAEDLAPKEFNRAEQWFEPVKAPAEDLFGSGGPGAAPASAARKLDLISFNEAARAALHDPGKPLIKGLLDHGSLSVVYGESNIGKTFVAMDMARAVAMGATWGGLRTAKSGVLYVAAEGGKGAKKRCAAILRRYPGMKDAQFSLIMENVNLLRADADLRAIIDAIKARPHPIGLIVIDTLSRVMAGGDENSSTDMGALVRHFDALRQATGAHVMVVHHSGKDASRGARGHSLLRAATDTEIEISEGKITVTKQRDLDGSFSRGFKLNPIELGKDAEGDPITSCTIILLAVGITTAAPMPEKQRRVYEAAKTFSNEHNPTDGMRPMDIANVLQMTTEQVRAHLKIMLKSGHVSKSERMKDHWFVLQPIVAAHFEPPSEGALEASDIQSNRKFRSTLDGAELDPVLTPAEN